MTLRPDVAALVAAMATTPPFEELGAVEARRASTARRLANPVEPPAVASVEQVAVPAIGRTVPVRVYRAHPVDPAPVVVFVHGGGWTICDLDSHDVLCRRLVRASGCTFVSVDYRLAPEHPFPAGLDDVEVVVEWVGHNLDALGVGPTIGLAGDSAGANLALVTALGRRHGSPVPVGALALLYPVTDAHTDRPSYREHATGLPLTRAAMEWYWAQYAPDPALRSDPRLSPLREPDVSGLAPTYLTVAGLDPLRDDGEAMALRLSAAGVQVTLERHLQVFHGYASIPSLPESQQAIDGAGTHLRRHLVAS